MLGFYYLHMLSNNYLNKKLQHARNVFLFITNIKVIYNETFN